MEYEDRGHVTQFVSGLVLGVVIGAGAALLSAPQTGKRTRKRIRRAAEDVRESATDRWDEVSSEMRGRVDDVISDARKKIRR